MGTDTAVLSPLAHLSGTGVTDLSTLAQLQGLQNLDLSETFLVGKVF
jgi:hypothetical protein